MYVTGLVNLAPVKVGSQSRLRILQLLALSFPVNLQCLDLLQVIEVGYSFLPMQEGKQCFARVVKESSIRMGVEVSIKALHAMELLG